MTDPSFYAIVPDAHTQWQPVDHYFTRADASESTGVYIKSAHYPDGRPAMLISIHTPDGIAYAVLDPERWIDLLGSLFAAEVTGDH